MIPLCNYDEACLEIERTIGKPITANDTHKFWELGNRQLALRKLNNYAFEMYLMPEITNRYRIVHTPKEAIDYLRYGKV